MLSVYTVLFPLKYEVTLSHDSDAAFPPPQPLKVDPFFFFLKNHFQSIKLEFGAFYARLFLYIFQPLMYCQTCN